MMYRTTDVHVAAFLMARGHQLEGLEQTGKPGQAAFVFGTGAEDVDRFFQGEQVEAKAFAAALRDLKRLLHQRLSQKR